jgi:hypothetical protein
MAAADPTIASRPVLPGGSLARFLERLPALYRRPRSRDGAASMAAWPVRMPSVGRRRPLLVTAPNIPIPGALATPQSEPSGLRDQDTSSAAWRHRYGNTNDFPAGVARLVPPGNRRLRVPDRLARQRPRKSRRKPSTLNLSLRGLDLNGFYLASSVPSMFRRSCGDPTPNLSAVRRSANLFGKSGGNTSRSCRCAFVIASILRPADRRIFVRHLGLRYLLDGRLPVSLDAGR